MTTDSVRTPPRSRKRQRACAGGWPELEEVLPRPSPAPGADIQTLLDALPHPVFFKDASGRILGCNKAFESLRGLSRSTLLGLSMADLADPEMRPLHALRERQLLETGEPQTYEALCQDSTGAFRQMVFHKALWPDPAGGPARVLTTLFDVTQRKWAEELLHESERRFQTLFEQTAAGVAQIETATDRLVLVNQRYCDIMGYSREELLGKTVGELTHPDDIPLDRAAVEDIKAGRLSFFEMEKRYVRKDGAVIWAHLSVSPLWEPNKAIPDFHIVAVEDVTDRRRAQAALAQAEREMALLFDSAPVPMLLLGQDQRIQRANSLAVTTCRTPRSAVTGLRSGEALSCVNFLHNPTACGAGSACAECGLHAMILDTLHNRATRRQEEFLLHVEGPHGPAPLHVLASCVPLRLNGEDCALLSLADITPIKQAEASVRASEARYHSLFSNNHAVMLLVDPERERILDANPAACRYYGYSPEEFADLPVSRINSLPGADLRANLRKALDGASSPFRFRHRLASGEVRDVEVYSGPIQLEDKTVLYSLVHDVTDRIAAEGALKRSEERFRLASQVASDLIYEWDVAAGTLDWFGDLRAALGYDPAEQPLSLDQWLALIHPEDRPRMVKAVARQKRFRTPGYTDEYRLRRKDGSWVCWEDKGIPWTNPEGRPVKWIGACTDITQRKQAQAALAARLRHEQGLAEALSALLPGLDTSLDTALEHLLRATGACRVYLFENFEDARDGLCMRQTHEACAPGVSREIINPQLRHVPYSAIPRWRDTLGKGHEISGLVETFPEAERPGLEAQGILSMLVLPISVQGAWWGLIGFDDTRSRRVWDAEDRNILRTAAHMIGDYLTRRRAEESLRLSKSCFESLHVLARMSDACEADIIQFSLEEGVRLTKSAIGYLHFVIPNDDSGVNLELFTWSGKTHAECTAPKTGHYPLEEAGVWADSLRLRRPVLHNDYPGLPNRRGMPEGHVSLQRHLGVPVTDGEAIVAVAGVGNKEDPYDESDVQLLTAFLQGMWDILRRKRTVRELEKAKEAAEAANQAKSTFLATMSHEVRTPLNGMLGMLQLLTDTSLDTQQMDYASTAAQSGRNLLAILNDILDLSVVESGKLVLKEEPFDIRDLLRQTAETFATQAAGKNLSLRWSASPDLPRTLLGDAGRLRQVLFNLAGNAVKFTERGEVRIEAWLGTSGPDARLMLQVSDTGIGIPPGREKELFAPFSQLDGGPSRRYGGTGLGLAIVDRFSRHMGGHVEVASQRGKGAAFTVTLPFRTPAPLSALPVQEPAPSPAESGGEVSSARRSLRVLVAEDEPVNQFFLRRLLEGLGHSAACAATGLEALALLADGPFDVVFMDVQMPDMDGLEATSLIRSGQIAGAADIPVIAVTAHAMAGDRERFLAAGMSGYLAKPIDMEALQAVLARFDP